MTPQERIKYLREKAAANREKLNEAKKTTETSKQSTTVSVSDIQLPGNVDSRPSPGTEVSVISNSQVTGVEVTKNDSSDSGMGSLVPSNELASGSTGSGVSTGSDVLLSAEYEPFKMKLAELQQALENEVPDFPLLLRDIHRTMSDDPNVVTIMTPEEIGTVVAGLSRHTNTTIVTAKPTKTAKRTQPLTADDL